MKWIEANQITVDIMDLETKEVSPNGYDIIEVIEGWDEACLDAYEQYGINNIDDALDKFNNILAVKHLSDFILVDSYLDSSWVSHSTYKRK